MIALRHFTEDELRAVCEGGAAERFQPNFLLAIDAYRERLGSPVVFMPTTAVSPSDGSVQPVAGWCTFGHSDDSRHYAGDAGDFYFPGLPLGTALMWAWRSPAFTGVGVYPFWAPDPGLHLDTRPLTLRDGDGLRMFWWRDAVGAYHYLRTQDDIQALLALLPRVG